jgi:flagellar hook assembly protein FlgD
VNRTSTVSIRIYNQNGRLVQRINNARSGVTTWDGRDFYGRKLANGLYHYVVTCDVEADDTS